MMCGVMVEAENPIDCIPHPYWMNTKCFSTLRCFRFRWAYGYLLMTYTITCAGGGEFQEKRGMTKPV
jgi:hypothetical protein